MFNRNVDKEDLGARPQTTFFLGRNLESHHLGSFHVTMKEIEQKGFDKFLNTGIDKAVEIKHLFGPTLDLHIYS